MPDISDPVYYEIVAARVKLLFEQPFFGNLASRLIAVDASSWCKTAATDGRHLFYNRQFIASLDKSELLFLIGHEVLHCFPAGTLVPGTFKPIEQLEVGDPVVGLGGVRSTVIHSMVSDYSGDMYTIKARGMLPLEMTSEHPVLVSRPRWKNVRDPITGKKRNIREWDTARFVVAEALEEGDWIQVPRCKGQIEEPMMEFSFTGNPWSSPDELKTGVKIDQRVAEFLGYYVAEGSTTCTKDNDYLSCISLHARERQDAERLGKTLSEVFGIASSIQKAGENGIRLQFSSSPLGRWLRDACGHGALFKRVPEQVLYNADLGVAAAFLKAYIAGDGHVGKAVNFGTASLVLAHQIQFLWARFGVLMNLYKRDQKPAVKKDGSVIKGGVLYVGLVAHEDAFKVIDQETDAIRSSRYAGVCDDGLWTPIKKITKRAFAGKVYNIETSCHTFAAGNIMTHNCVYDHLGRRGSRDPKLWNMANDYIVNWTLKHNKIGTMPKCGLYDERFNDGMISEEVYEVLKKDSVTIKMTLDEHLELSEGGEDDEDGDGEGKSVEVTITGKDGPPKLTEDDIAKIRSEIKSAVIQAAQAVGADKVPAGIRRMIDELVSPKMDWRALLDTHIRSSMKDDYTFQRMSRHSWGLASLTGHRFILPAQDYMDTIDIAIAIDCSGSMTQDMLRDFLSETKGIMETFKDFRIKLWVFDTEVYNYKEFSLENLDEITEYPMAGGGGTMFECNWEYMKRQGIEPERFVMFTDGYPNSGWGDENYCDTLFVIYGDTTGRIEAPFGITAHYEEKGKTSFLEKEHPEYNAFQPLLKSHGAVGFAR